LATTYASSNSPAISSKSSGKSKISGVLKTLAHGTEIRPLSSHLCFRQQKCQPQRLHPTIMISETTKHLNVGFISTGMMVSPIMDGLVNKGVTAKDKVACADPCIGAVEKKAAQGCFASQSNADICQCPNDTINICVKPQYVVDVCCIDCSLLIHSPRWSPMLIRALMSTVNRAQSQFSHCTTGGLTLGRVVFFQNRRRHGVGRKLF